MFNCQACKAKDDEIKHLRALVDSILLGKGLAPVSQGVQAQEPTELEVKETIPVSEDNIQRYGGDEE